MEEQSENYKVNIKFLLDSQKKLRNHLEYINRGDPNNEDILQEFNQKFILNVRENKIEGITFRYLRVSITNQLTDIRRKNKVRNGLNTPSSFEPVFLQSEEMNFEQPFNLNLEPLFVKCKLSKREQRVLTTYLFNNSNQIELARTIGLHPAYFKACMFRLRKKLRRKKRYFTELHSEMAVVV